MSFFYAVLPQKAHAATCYCKIGSEEPICMDETVCSDQGGACVRDCDWEEVLGVEKDDIHLLGIDMELTEFKNLIKTIMTVWASSLVFALILVIAYGGILWASSGPNEEKIKKGQKVMKNGVMAIVIAFGFLIVFALFAGIAGIEITDLSFLDDIFGGS